MFQSIADNRLSDKSSRKVT